MRNEIKKGKKNPLFLFRYLPINLYRFCLANSMTTTLSLNIILRIPITIKNNTSIGNYMRMREQRKKMKLFMN